MATRFQRLPAHIFDYAGLRYATDDMARRRPTWETQNVDDANGSRNNF